MKITRTIGYAIHATLELAEHEHGSPIPCSELAQRRGLPPRFLLQILRILVKKGVLRSAQGVFGGYSLDRSPDAVTLLEIVEALDEPFSPALPQLPSFPPAIQDQLASTMERAAKAAKLEMGKLTLGQLLRAAKNDRQFENITPLDRDNQAGPSTFNGQSEIKSPPSMVTSY
ncbi:MAG TPA: Rrf2 family transcriptional regulator [Lacipirellulaceae bacterium]|nr:Rrf2 family transcriptional regulator [Lacipirellulaceae bacterium]